jgi:hypothetical protein
MIAVKILTFPLRLVFFIVCWVLRIALLMIGLILMFFSEFASKLLSVIGFVISLGALLITVYTISRAKKGESVSGDIPACVLAWVISFAMFAFPIIGGVASEFLIDIGFSITSFAEDVLMLDF